MKIGKIGKKREVFAWINEQLKLDREKKKQKTIHMRRTGQFSQGSDDSSGASQSCISNRYRDNLEKSETSLLLNEGLQ